MAKVSVGLDLGGREGQHAIGRQRAGDGRLVHIGREAVPAVEFTGDVPMVILRKDKKTNRVKSVKCVGMCLCRQKAMDKCRCSYQARRTDN